MHLDPEDISIQATKVLDNVRTERLSGPYVTSDDKYAMLELHGEELIHEPIESAGSYEADLTDNGVKMIEMMGLI